MHDSIANHIEDIRTRMREAAGASLLGRKAVELVAVSKGQPAEKLEQALQDGLRCFGENRVQEAAAKWPGLRARFTDIQLHLIGPLQTNKVAEAVALFDVIQTLDRPKLADALAAEMQATGRHLPCFVQVNIGEEPQKSGVAPQDISEFLDYCRDKLEVVGLMCIPPQHEPAAQYFGLLQQLALRHGLSGLSMGMSGDFETAIRFGATHIRVGTALFGERQAAISE
jgi:PLP dependent protein